jgi:Ca2+-transporting ATPase
MPLPDIEDIKAPWSTDHKSIITQLHADSESGLSSTESERRLGFVGYNKIESGKRISPLMILVNQFISPFVLLLAIAAGLSFFFKEWLDGIAIIVVIVINALIGFFMEFQAERSMEALKKLTTVPARVLRNGKLTEIPSEEIVPGDILFAEGGDMITAMSLHLPVNLCR